MSAFALVALVALLYVLVVGLANPRTRPFIIGLGVFVGLGIVFLFFFAVHRVQTVRFQDQAFQDQAQSMEQFQQQQAQSFADEQQEQAHRLAHKQTPTIVLPPVASPPKSAATERKPPKTTLLAALRQAALQAWTGGGAPPLAEAPQKTLEPPKTSQPDEPPKSEPPAWVNAPAKMEDNRYQVSVAAGPFTTPLECARELPEKIQAALTEYAEISLGPEAAEVRLPDDALQQLVRQRWTEVRPMVIDGGSQDMHTLHALVVFDASAQQRINSEVQRIKAEDQRSMIFQRVKAAALVFGGVIGLLALTWGGLRWTQRERRGLKDEG